MQGVLVNGSKGIVVDFMTVQEATLLPYGEHMDRVHLGYLSRELKPLTPEHMDNEVRRAARRRYEKEMLQVMGSPVKWPVVRFGPVNRSGSSIHVVCVFNKFEVTDALGHVLAEREQVSASRFLTSPFSTGLERCP